MFPHRTEPWESLRKKSEEHRKSPGTSTVNTRKTNHTLTKKSSLSTKELKLNRETPRSKWCVERVPIVYYERLNCCFYKSRNREPVVVCLIWIDEVKANIKPIHECRCNERLQTKRFIRLSHTGLFYFVYYESGWFIIWVVVM